MSTLLTPTIIIKKTQLRKVVSLLKGFGRHFYVEDKKMIFDLKGCDSNREFLDRRVNNDSTMSFDLLKSSHSFHFDIPADKKVWDEMIKLLEGPSNMIVIPF